jgi:hypothetical protein
MPDNENNEQEFERAPRLKRDLARAARAMSPEQARYLVDAYYTIQEHRIALAAQLRHAEETGERKAAEAVEGDSPIELIRFMFEDARREEENIRLALDEFSNGPEVGRWAKSILGIGPVLSAGLLAHVDITRAMTAGAIWRFAGLDSTVQWHGREDVRTVLSDMRKVARNDWDAFANVAVALDHDKPSNVLRSAGLIEKVASIGDTKALFERLGAEWPEAVEFHADNAIRLAFEPDERGEVYEMLYPEAKLDWKAIRSALSKRPWNTRLKVLTWKVGESFIKVSNNEKDFYGHVYAERRRQEEERNDKGEYAEEAAKVLRERRIGANPTREAYEAGRLPDGRIHLRASRYAVKLFLAHWHDVAFRDHYGTAPPRPYVIEHLGHAHFIEPPNMPEHLRGLPDFNGRG